MNQLSIPITTAMIQSKIDAAARAYGKAAHRRDDLGETAFSWSASAMGALQDARRMLDAAHNALTGLQRLAALDDRAKIADWCAAAGPIMHAANTAPETETGFYVELLTQVINEYGLQGIQRTDRLGYCATRVRPGSWGNRHRFYVTRESLGTGARVVDSTRQTVIHTFPAGTPNRDRHRKIAELETETPPPTPGVIDCR